jgi:NADPH-dependent curcumin reductase CurA
MQNRKIVLTRVIRGIPEPNDFDVTVDPAGEPAHGQLLVRHVYLSLDPYQRPAMAGRHGGGVALSAGDMPRGETIGQVLATRHAGFREGDYVRHFGGWQEYSVADGDEVTLADPRRAPLSTFLGVLGMPGLTAYASIIKLDDVQEGQTVLVSAASGPVGSTLGQIAIKKGAQVIGIAGSNEKCVFVTEDLGFDACVNYKDDAYPESLAKIAGEGVDIYHDNVGGRMLAEGMAVLKPYGTVILCGLMSSYNDPSQDERLYIGLPIMKRAVIRGLVVYDFEDQRDEFIDLVAPWIRAGEFVYKEDRADGIENAGAHFSRLMRGENFGKSLVVIGPE